MKRLALLAVLFVVAGCSSVTPVGRTNVVDKGGCRVTVYQSEDAAKKGGVIEELCVIQGTSSASGAIFHHTPEHAIRKHARKACGCGSNRVYIQSQAMTGMALASVTMVAFKYTGEKQQKESESTSYIDELKALAALRDEGIITEGEFQKQKTKILANTQRIQTPVQPKPQIEEVDHANIRNIVGDPSSNKHNSSIPGDVINQRSHDSENPLIEEARTTDKGNSEQKAGNQNDSSEVKKTEWVQEVGGRKIYCVRTDNQTICQ